jgi:glycine/D-amino acid oxidase-like deaminating enzyme
VTNWPTDAPSPLWRALSNESFSAEELTGACEVDAAIIGAGVSGLAAALALAGRGMGVVVLEAATVGAGASGRANGQIIPTLTRHDPEAIVRLLGDERGERFLELLAGSADRLFGTVARYDIDCDARRTGWLQPAHTPDRARLATLRAEQWRSRGAPVEVLDRTRMSERLGTDAYFGGWCHRGGGHVNPLALTLGLARAAVAEGVGIFERSPALTMVRDGRRWRIDSPKGRVLAHRVVFATAAHTGRIWPQLMRTIVPVTSYQAATVPLGRAAGAILPGDEAVSDTRLDLRYFRKDRDGRLVSGGALALQAGARFRLPKLVRRRLGAAFPALSDVSMEFFWGGRIAMTVDRLPHIHRTRDGVVAWVGCNGRGLALAFAMAEIVADAVTDVSEDRLPLPPIPLRQVPFQGLVTRSARLVLPWYRYRDRRW